MWRSKQLQCATIHCITRSSCSSCSSPWKRLCYTVLVCLEVGDAVHSSRDCTFFRGLQATGLSFCSSRNPVQNRSASSCWSLVNRWKHFRYFRPDGTECWRRFTLTERKLIYMNGTLQHFTICLHGSRNYSSWLASDEVEDQPASIAVYEASGSFYTAFAGSKMKPLQLIIKQRAYYHRSCIRRSLVESERLHLTQPISSTEPKMVISINF